MLLTTSQVEISSEDINIFTNGQCHILANQIQELTGWPIHCFTLKGCPLPEGHAFVVPRAGWRLDIEGLTSDQKHNKRWDYGEPAKHRSFSYEEILDAWFTDHYDYAVERAKELAPYLISLAS